MNFDSTRGARFAAWWVEAITRTAEPSVALDRRAEICSDTHEQLSDAWRRGAVSVESRAVVGRVIRGMPADIAWRAVLELRMSRFAWHLRNPSTAITSFLVVMLPLNLAADSALPQGRSSLLDYRIPLWVATDFVGGCILLFAVLAFASRVRPRLAAGAEPFQSRSRLEAARRCATATLGVTLAGSAVFRFGALALLGGGFWLAFAACVLVYVALLLATLGVKLLTFGRYRPNIRA